MATKSEHRRPPEGTSRGLHEQIDTHSPDETQINGFDENSSCPPMSMSYEANKPQSSSKNALTNCENGSQPAIDRTYQASFRRRSTRACAIKAAERIKLKESLTPIMDGLASNSGEGYMSCDEDINEDGPKPPKVRRMAEGNCLDQMNSRFGIKMDGDDVLLMTSESEFSSLDGEEFEQIKKSYEKTVHKEMAENQRRETEMQVKKLEAELRAEEAKLIILKKVMLSQKVSFKQLQEANVRKMTANVSQNGSGNAYKPPVATPHNRTNVNSSTCQSKGSSSINSSRVAASAAQALMNLTPQQQQLLQNAAKSGILNTVAAQALLQQVQQAQMNGRVNPQHAAALAAFAQQQHPSRGSNVANPSSAKESPAQKAAAAKLALHRQLEQQLLQIPPPQPAPPDMHFIPNGNQPDFCSLLGIDIIVQRLLKDKNATRRVSEEPYICEECGSDYTPIWRAIGADSDSLHLYCEACVKAAQKKKMRLDHTAVLRSAFNKVLEKEQELDKQIAEGKYDNPAPSSSTPRSGTPAATPPSSKTQISISSAQANTSKSVSSSSQGHPHHHSQSNKHSSHRRPNIGTSSGNNALTSHNAGAAAAALAATSSNTNPSVLLQQQMAAAAALRHTNPMLAAMMANPLLNAPNMLQMPWNPLLQQRLPNFAMAALAQAVHSAQQSGGANVANPNSAAAAAAAAAAASLNPLTALAATMSPAAAAMFSNPQMVRQFQQAQQVIHRNILLEYAKNQSKK